MPEKEKTEKVITINKSTGISLALAIALVQAIVAGALYLTNPVVALQERVSSLESATRAQQEVSNKLNGAVSDIREALGEIKGTVNAIKDDVGDIKTKL